MPVDSREGDAAPSAPPRPAAAAIEDGSAYTISPTGLTLPVSLIERIKYARGECGATTTSVVLDALRAHVHELGELVIQRRPEQPAADDDLFPYSRSGTVRAAAPTGSLALRPTRGDLVIIDRLVENIDQDAKRRHPGARKVSRSEMVAAALDAFLPPAGKRRGR